MSRPPGQVFTPDAVADRLWAAAARAWRGSGTPRVIEPSAGDGALARAISRAGTAADLTLVELDPALVSALRAQHPSACVVHADALTLSRGEAPQSDAGAAYGASSPRELRDENRSENSGGAQRAAPHLLACDWADIVIANPPYLRETGNRDILRAVRTWNEGALAPLYRKDADLHHFFWDIAIRWLRPGGILAFLTPAYFLEAEAAAPLRARLVSEGRVLGVYRTGTDTLFPNTGVEAAITLWRKADTGPCHRLDARLLPDGDAFPLDPNGGPWWLRDAPNLRGLAALGTRLGDLYTVSEGVSTGANRVRKADAHLVPEASGGEGIMVLGQDAMSALRDDTSRAFLHQRLRAAAGPPEWIVIVRDGELPRLDRGEPPQTDIERHLVRYRPILEKRAEMSRNSARSWYATAWPRPELFAPGAIVTPKWSRDPAFAPMPADRVPMTDFRILVPRAALGRVPQRDAVLEWLNGPEVRPWFAQRMKRKGTMTEWYGAGLAGIPIPDYIANR